MAVRKHRAIRKALKKKGFVPDASGDHIFFRYPHKGRQTSVYTKLSHGAGGGDVGSSLIGKMARQCRLSKHEFLELVDCPLSEDEYREKLLSDGHI